MASTVLDDREWRRLLKSDEFMVSTKIELLDLDFINTAFGTKDMYWAKTISRDLIATMLSNSVTLGLYKVLPAAPAAKSDESPSSPRTPSPTLEDAPKEQLQQVGMARFITDRITTSYLTDVYVDPEYRKDGLGKWLVACCKEILELLPAMRRAFLLASPDVGKAFYTRELGFWDIEEEKEHLACMTRRAYKLSDE